MPDLPTYIYPFIFALIAALAGRILGGPARENPESLPRWILYAIAVGCVAIGFSLMWLGGVSDLDTHRGL